MSLDKKKKSCSIESNEVSGLSLDFNYILPSQVHKGPTIRNVYFIPEMHQRLIGPGIPETLVERRNPTDTKRLDGPGTHQPHSLPIHFTDDLHAPGQCFSKCMVWPGSLSIS